MKGSVGQGSVLEEELEKMSDSASCSSASTLICLLHSTTYHYWGAIRREEYARHEHWPKLNVPATASCIASSGYIPRKSWRPEVQGTPSHMLHPCINTSRLPERLPHAERFGGAMGSLARDVVAVELLDCMCLQPLASRPCAKRAAMLKLLVGVLSNLQALHQILSSSFQRNTIASRRLQSQSTAL